MAWGTVNVQSAGSKSAPNGAEWTQSNLTNVTVNKIYHANGLWVLSTAGKGLYYSEDGKTWTQTNVTSGDFWDVLCDEGSWVAGSSDSGAYFSKNGTTWTKLTNSNASGDRRNVIRILTFWAISGPNASNVAYTYSSTLSAGMTWSIAGTGGALYTVRRTVANSAYLDGVINGYSFTNCSTWPSNYSNNTSFRNRTLKGMPVTVDDGKTFECWSDGIYIYSNSLGYTRYVLITTGEWISYGNGLVIVTGSTMKPRYYANTATDASSFSFTECSVAPLGIQKSFYGNGVWVGTGTAGTFIANNNLEWSQTSTIKSNYALYADGVWVLGGNGNGVYYSEAFTSKE